MEPNLTSGIQDSVTSAVDDEPASHWVLVDIVPMAPDAWKLIKIGLAVFFIAIIAIESDGHAEERGSDNELALLAGVVNVVPGLIPYFNSHSQVCSCKLALVNRG